MSGARVDPKKALSRTFLDGGMVRWEAYVSGGQPNTPHAARIYFVCLEDPFAPPRWLPHESRSVAEATRALTDMGEGDLLELHSRSTPLE